MRDRNREFRRVPLAELMANPANWRQHPSDQRRALRAVLEEIGFVGSLLAFEGPQGLTLIDGHLRQEEIQGLDADFLVPVAVTDLTQEEADKVLVTYDPLSALATTDGERLATLLDELSPSTDALNEYLEELRGSVTLEGMLDEQPNWRDLTDRSRVQGDTAQDHYGYNGGSVWPGTGDNETRAASSYLKLPVNPGRHGDGTPGKEQMIQRYSRSPFMEMECIVRTYMRPGDYFLEACAGWWTFSTMASAWGHAGVGIDIWDVSLAFGRRQLRRLPAGSGEVKVRRGDALAMPFKDATFDFVYCNPPFWQLERYSKSENDIGGAPTFEAWCDRSRAMLVEMGRVVKPGGLLATVMADFREKGWLVPLHSTWLRLGEEAGLGLWDLAVQPMQSQQFIMWRRDGWNFRRTLKTHEYVIVFRRAPASGRLGEFPSGESPGPGTEEEPGAELPPG